MHKQPSLSDLFNRKVKVGAINDPMSWKHISPQTLNRPQKTERTEFARIANGGQNAAADKRDERRARRKKRMRLRARRGRGCAG